MKYVVLDPGSSDPTYGPVSEAVIVDGPYNAEDEDIRAALGSAIRSAPLTMLLPERMRREATDDQRHPVFVTDDGIVVTCDLCDGPQRVEGDDWNGETGNHYSCEGAAQPWMS